MISRTSQPVVRFDRVTLGYDKQGFVLRDVSFELEPGSFTFLTGDSGAGKSTLLQLIYLALRPNAGQISLFGEPVRSMDERALMLLRRRMGIVFQDFRLLDHLSTFDNAALPLRVQGRKPDQYRADVAELLNWVGLGHRMDARPAELSGGEKQRLAIARAVVAQPALVLADEPTGNVDPAMSRRLLRLLVELNRMGTTILIATHDTRLVEQSGMPAMHLEDGRLSSGAGQTA